MHLPAHVMAGPKLWCPLQIYMQYPFERTVESVVKKSVFEGRGFGAKMTVEQLIAKQTRIERSALAASTFHCAASPGVHAAMLRCLAMT